MSNIFAQFGTSQSYLFNLEKTILAPITPTIATILKHQNSKLLITTATLIWGCFPKYDSLNVKAGDTLLFFYVDKLVAKGLVLSVFKSKDISLKLWGSDCFSTIIVLQKINVEPKTIKNKIIYSGFQRLEKELELVC